MREPGDGYRVFLSEPVSLETQPTKVMKKPSLLFRPLRSLDFCSVKGLYRYFGRLSSVLRPLAWEQKLIVHYS